MLRSFIQQYDLKVVGISSWFTAGSSRRFGYGGHTPTTVGTLFGFEIMDVSYITSGSRRDVGAEAWMKDNAHLGIEEYVYLDDGDHVYADPLSQRIVAPSGRYGLQQIHINQMKEILKL